MAARPENVRRLRDAGRVIPERLVRFRLRTVLSLLATIIAVAIALEVIWIARHVLTWILISLFLALALNPAVDWLQRKGLSSRGAAAGITFLLAIGIVVGIGFAFVPTLVHQVNDFVQKLPDYVDDVTNGRGRLGFLETKYHIQERIQAAVKDGGATKVLGLSGAALSVAKSVIAIVVATVTIIFMTFFMLLEGPAWVERFYGLLPAQSQPRWRKVGGEIYRTVGGYVTGNLLISLIAGSLDDGRAADHGRAVCGGARADRRDPRPDPARRRDDRGDPRSERSRSCTRSRPGSS